MEKTTKVFESNVDLPIVSWNQYFSYITRSPVVQTVTEYDVNLGYEETDKGNEDSVYRREMIVLEDLDNPAQVAKKQFRKQLSQHGSGIYEFSPDFQTSAESAAFEAYNNFSPVSNSALVNLGRGEYVLAPYTKDDIVFKYLSIAQGAIVVYRPKMFIRFKSNPPTLGE